MPTLNQTVHMRRACFMQVAFAVSLFVYIYCQVSGVYDVSQMSTSLRKINGNLSKPVTSQLAWGVKKWATSQDDHTQHGVGYTPAWGAAHGRQWTSPIWRGNSRNLIGNPSNHIQCDKRRPDNIECLHYHHCMQYPNKYLVLHTVSYFILF